jgi:hypothetical protein
MTMLVQLESLVESRPARSAVHRREYKLPAAPPPEAARHPELTGTEIAFRIFATFRAHPHISNVLTHISRADWPGVERALNRILDLATTGEDFSPLEHNIIDLMCAERGVTGKILRPYFHAVLHKLLPRNRAERLIGHVDALFAEIEWRTLHPAAPVPNVSAPESDHDRIAPASA